MLAKGAVNGLLRLEFERVMLWFSRPWSSDLSGQIELGWDKNGSVERMTQHCRQN